MKPPFSDLPLGKLNNISATIAFILSVPTLSLAFSPAVWAVEKTVEPTETKSKVESTEKVSKKTSTRYDSVFELGEMTVTAAPSGKLESRDILSSVDIMNADKIANQNVLTSFDLFHRMPGVQITQFNQGTTTGKFSFRGFNGEGNINGIKLLIDGIPSKVLSQSFFKTQLVVCLMRNKPQ